MDASGGLEYETAYAFGPVVGVDDIDALTFAGYLMNEHGMDPISFGATLSAAMELYEMGILTTKDTDGIPLNFGNAEALTVMAEKTGKYEGFGQVLALGSKRMCEKYGHPEISMAHYQAWGLAMQQATAVHATLSMMSLQKICQIKVLQVKLSPAKHHKMLSPL